MKITAAVARAPRAPLSIETLDLAPPGPGEILVKVAATGICHTDLVMRDQGLPTPQPVVLGHEGAGHVIEIGAGVTKVRPGDPVVMTFNSCGLCPSCAAGHDAYCHDFFPRNFLGARPDGSSALSQNGQVVHANIFGQSSFASHAICTERNVVKVPGDVPIALLGPLACGVQTGAGAVLNAHAVRPGQSVAIFGTGSVGLSAVMAAHLIGAAAIIAIDVNAERLELATALGATHAIDPRRGDPGEAILAATRGIGTDHAIDTTGLPAVIDTALRALAPRGICGLVGVAPPGAVPSYDHSRILSGGRTIRGIVEGDAEPDVLIPALIDLHRLGRFPFDRLVKFYPFEAINQAIDDAERGHAIKPVVVMPA